jgi:mevalonate kinase
MIPVTGRPLMFSGCGKFILVGEHFVLYDIPALALPWPEGRVTLWEDALSSSAPEVVSQVWERALEHLQLPTLPVPSVRIESTLPQGCGLGSSAAFCVALVRLLAHKAGLTLSVEEVIETATVCEGLFHGRSSGVDPSIAATESILRVHMGHPHETIPWRLSEEVGFVLAVGPEPRQTATAVARVRQFSEESPERFAVLLDKMKSLVAEVESLMTNTTSQEALASAERLGELLTENHSALRETGVSSDSLETMVTAALEAGAWGAKLTGAGMGGSMIALAHRDQLSSLQNALASAGARLTFTTFPAQGETP